MRTSKATEPFVGTCVKCGKRGFKFHQENEECYGEAPLTPRQAVLALAYRNDSGKRHKRTLKELLHELD